MRDSRLSVTVGGSFVVLSLPISLFMNDSLASSCLHEAVYSTVVFNSEISEIWSPVESFSFPPALRLRCNFVSQSRAWEVRVLRPSFIGRRTSLCIGFFGKDSELVSRPFPISS